MPTDYEFFKAIKATSLTLNLSLEAKGLYSYLLAIEANEIKPLDLVRVLKVDFKKIQTLLNELKALNLIELDNNNVYLKY